MPRYKELADYRDNPPDYYPEKADWIARQLLRLRHDLKLLIPRKGSSRSLMLGSWNIKKFGKNPRRLDESFHYIAEIVSRFDLCAIQEVMGNLKSLEKLIHLLGPSWDYVVSDVSFHGSGGVQERMAFVFNTNRVNFKSEVGEIVLDRKALLGQRQPARSPYFARFEAGWFNFVVCGAHIAFDIPEFDQDEMKGAMREGETEAEFTLRYRASEIAAIKDVLVKRSKKEKEVYFFLGDMNIEAPDGIIMQALDGDGMHAKDFGPTNFGKKKHHFDNIAYTLFGKRHTKPKYVNHGSFDWSCSVFGPRPEQIPIELVDHMDGRPTDDEFMDHYEPIIQAQRAVLKSKPHSGFRKNYLKNVVSNQMSDHMPVWVELEVDFSDGYLRKFTK